MKLKGCRPYLVRAIHEWITDQGQTPYLLIDATWPDTHVPQGYVEDGRIVLNASLGAVRDLSLGNEVVSFSARFAGRPELIHVPVAALLGIYARETGEGLFFDEDEYPRDTPPAPESAPAGSSTGGRSFLRVVK